MTDKKVQEFCNSAYIVYLNVFANAILGVRSLPFNPVIPLPRARARYPLAFFPFHSRGPSTFSYFLHSADLRNRQPHRNRQRSYTLPQPLVPRPAQDLPRLFNPLYALFDHLAWPLCVSLSLSLSFLRRIDFLALSVFPCFSRSRAHSILLRPLAVREIDSSYSFLLLRCIHPLTPSGSPTSQYSPLSLDQPFFLGLLAPFLPLSLLFQLSSMFNVPSLSTAALSYRDELIRIVTYLHTWIRISGHFPNKFEGRGPLTYISIISL